MASSWEPSASNSEGRRRSSRSQLTATNREVPESMGQIIQNAFSSTAQAAAPQTRRSRRSRQTEATANAGDAMDEVMKPLSDEERREWNGWVELESDPALFNFILRQYGVEDVKIQEVLSLDDEMLALLPKPMYGLVFLFKYRDNDSENGDQVSKCPKDVWFANQTTTNACATIALLNVVMNIPEIKLGSALSIFKEDTQPLEPACRGYKLGNDNFIRNKHNSFARKMDMRSADLTLSNEATDWKKSQNVKRRKAPATKQTKRRVKDEDEPGFHFIAYVPVKGDVWRLDGLQKEPVNLGAYKEEWMSVARENIYERIGQYDEDGLQFNLLALCRSPLKSIPEKLAQSIRSILAVEEALTSASPDWKSFLEHDERVSLKGPDEAYDLPQDLLSQAQLPESARRRVEDMGADPSRLMELHGGWMKLQSDLRNSYIEEVALIVQENEQAARRQVDYTPLIYASVKTLAEDGVLKEIVKTVKAYES